MTICIDARCTQPIYEQIVNQIKEHILSGALPPDTPLPSIRALARELKISVITTKRAYDELENDGYIYTVAGKGCFVAQLSRVQAQSEFTQRIRQQLTEIERLAKIGGVRFADVQKMLEEMEWEDRT